jgi:thiamine-phosphate pyrophosphorylase
MAISDRRLLQSESFEDWCTRLARAGVDALQLREKDLEDREIYELALRARQALPTTTALLINGRADIAIAAGAQGVHLPADGIPAAAIRRRFGTDLVIGRSTHAPHEVTSLARAEVDYVLFGPVYATPSKQAYGPPLGLEALRRAAASGPPVLAVGGVTIEHLSEVAEAGAAGAAGIRVFYQPSLQRLAREAAHRFARS